MLRHVAAPVPPARANVTADDALAFQTLPSASNLRHLFHAIHQGGAVGLFSTVVWGSSTLSNTCPVDSYIVALHRFLCDDPNVLHDLQHHGADPAAVETDAQRRRRVAAAAIVRMHRLALSQWWDAARAAVVLYLLFETDYADTGQGWPVLRHTKFNMWHANHHLELLLATANGMVSTVSWHRTLDCPRHCGLHGQQSEPNWCGVLPARQAASNFQTQVCKSLCLFSFFCIWFFVGSFLS